MFSTQFEVFFKQGPASNLLRYMNRSEIKTKDKFPKAACTKSLSFCDHRNYIDKPAGTCLHQHI